MSDEQNNENTGEGFKKLSEFEASQNQGSTENQQNENDEGDSDLQMPDELTLLKQRARLMGVQFSNNIGLDSLKARIKEHQEKSNQEADAGNADPEPDPEPEVVEVKTTKRKTAADIRKEVQQENMKLIRLRITNMDPKKANLPGEIITVANEYLGTVRKYVPFGEQTENGYHVPYCIYKQLRNRKFLSIKVTKKNGRETVTSQWVKEFALDILPPLTEGEIAKLAAAQSAAGGLDD